MKWNRCRAVKLLPVLTLAYSLSLNAQTADEATLKVD